MKKYLRQGILRTNFQNHRRHCMKNQYPPIVEKSLKLIEYLEEKFGWFVIRVYQFPLIPEFETFLESMQRTLTRHGLLSLYIWAKYTSRDTVLLVQFGRGFYTGHFEAEADKIIPRLWQRQTHLSYRMADTITVNQQNKYDWQDWLARFLLSVGYEQTAGPRVDFRWHEKSYGSSQINRIVQKKSSRF